MKHDDTTASRGADKNVTDPLVSNSSVASTSIATAMAASVCGIHMHRHVPYAVLIH